MAETSRLPGSVTVQYSELLQNCIHPLSDGSNISFKAKTVHGKRYWYLYISLGSSRREHYLGEETPELLDRIADEREAWESNSDDRGLREHLVSMLIAGGMTPTPRDEGKLLALLERSGVFLAGGTLVGTVAFRAYSNMLGVKWASAPKTQDVDIAGDNTVGVVLPRDKRPVHLGQAILDSGMGFFEVPALDRKRPSTSYRIRGREFRVDVLAPMRGRETVRPVRLDTFNTYAQPVRFLDYLLDDLQAAVLLFGHGIMVNVPSPARFALHKCVLSQMRTAAFATKGTKDIEQADQLFRILATDRPGDVVMAFEAAERMGPRFLGRMQAGIRRLSGDTRRLLGDLR